MQTSAPEAGPAPGPHSAWPWLLAPAVILFLAVAGAFAYYVIFSRFETYDDEGYLMISLRGYLEGYPLYDAVFTQYGPFYYLYHGLIRTLTAMPLTHDTTRLLCVVHWLAAAVILGWAGGVMTRSVPVALFVFMQAVMHLVPLSGEPGHPQELVALLLAIGLLAAAGGSHRPLTFVMLGAVGAALFLTKINAGLFFGVAVFLAMVFQARDIPLRRAWVCLFIGTSAALPFLLMRHHLGEAWCRTFCVVTAMAVVATGLVAAASAGERRLRLSSFILAGLGFVVPSAAILVAVLGQGTTVHALVDSLLLTASKFPSVFWSERPVSIGSLSVATLSLACAGYVSRAWREDSALRVAAVAKGIYGLLGSVALVTQAEAQLDYLLPWSWLVLLPTGCDPARRAREAFPRAVLALTATWQALQVYPMAGTQVAIATLPAVIVFTVCLCDALRAAATTAWAGRPFPQPAPRTAILLRTFAITALLAAFVLVWCKPHAWRRYYAGLEPSGLRGAERLRMVPETAKFYRDFMSYIEASCDTFITYPGLNSFYFWADKRPPTQFNTTGWMILLSDAQQDQVVDAMKRAERPIVIVNEIGVSGWKRYVDFEQKPLVRYIREDCHVIGRFGNFIIRKPDHVQP
ncbi:MAG: hypothetical protein V1929_11340 [bacterium]